ncbi:uncharacterized protein [Apostichopus japonicus]|uniref:uncharacterized protein isoform X2 n=1 Tax=Stichopus japonicus TaxID=307972 RepID=UPI003AB82898
MKVYYPTVVFLLIAVLRNPLEADALNNTIKPCAEICGCITPMVRDLHGGSGIHFEIDGNRFHLQKVLDDDAKKIDGCHGNVTIPHDGAYLECMERNLTCATSDLKADFSLDNVAQSRDANTRDYMSCWIEEHITKCFYRNATKNEEVEALTWPCVYEKPKKYCMAGFNYYKGLCVRNYTASTYRQAVNTCNTIEAELIGESKRDKAYVNQSEHHNERLWINSFSSYNFNGTCKSARNLNGILEGEPTTCSEELLVLCTMQAYKQLSCKTTPILDMTTEDPTTVFDMTTAAEETTKRMTIQTDRQPTTTIKPKQTTLEGYETETQEEKVKKELGQIQNKIEEYFEALNVSTPSIGDQKKPNSPLVSSLDSLIDRLANSISKSQKAAKPLTVETQSLVIKVVPLSQDTSSEELGGGVKNQTFTLDLPDGIKQAGVTLAMSGADVGQDSFPVTMEDSDAENEDDEGTKGVSRVYISSLVATISLRSQDGDNLGERLDEPLKISFSTSKRPDFVSSDDKLVPSCRFWKPSESGDGGVWSDEGCLVGFSNSTHTQCECYHLTSFAVLMSVRPVETLTESDVIHYMTLIGCSLSIFCLGLMLLVFTAQRLFRSDRNIIHMNLALSLMIGQLLFLVAIERTETEIVCKVIGMSLHFCFLGSFFWMLNEGMYLVSKTRSQNSKFLKMPTFLFVGWICPLIVVGITAGVSFESYGTEKQCWLRVDNGGIWAFVGPAIVIVIVNMIMLSNVIRVFLSLRANMKKKQVERTWLAIRAMLLTLPLLGLTWLFGLLTAIDSTVVVFEYLFVIFNSLQGVFIFVLYCVLNDEVRKSLQKKVYKLGFMSKTSAGRTSKTTA